MDPAEIVRYGGEALKIGTAVGAAVPFTALVKRILGPAADEIAERVRDEIRVYRYGRQLALLHKAERLALNAGYTPHAVNTKLLFSLLEGASLEENEDLHDKWAALLANAANPDLESLVRPSFTETLRLMTPEVARFLDAVFARATATPSNPAPAADLGIAYYEEKSPQPAAHRNIHAITLVDLGTYNTLFALFGKAGGTLNPPGIVVTSGSGPTETEQDEADRQNFAVVMDELNRFQMWNVNTYHVSGEHFHLSSYAAQFLAACQPPEPIEQQP